MEESLVSIIMPAYNAEKYLHISIESVLNQTYKSWELLICDDCSTDNTFSIITKYSKLDKRIKAYQLSTNQGAASARNFAIEKASGDYISFLDSDDMWKNNKLEKQISWMQRNNINFSCTYYGKIDENNRDLGQLVLYDERVDYFGLMKNCPGNSTVVYDSKKLGKFYISNIKKRNDYLMWLQVIKSSTYLYCLEEELSYHRIVEGSLSSSKKTLLKYHWYIYRNHEKISLLKSTYLINYWVCKGIKSKIISYYKRKEY
ncbi:MULTISPECIES: glycosyltransferase family 2 protein [Vagococcus]|uniref:glycosyltransferase family 2 protein n=1 Tax=Vagococcus TaxID=2737 RepID=UPI000E4F6E3C|nr:MULTISPECIES: glycosyltransferase family 2 protein [Vagococcus]RHH71582.1 glycosyltransferase family 2 protein [Vagococcus sp. AM17-17]